MVSVAEHNAQHQDPRKGKGPLGQSCVSPTNHSGTAEAGCCAFVLLFIFLAFGFALTLFLTPSCRPWTQAEIDGIGLPAGATNVARHGYGWRTFDLDGRRFLHRDGRGLLDAGSTIELTGPGE